MKEAKWISMKNEYKNWNNRQKTNWSQQKNKHMTAKYGYAKKNTRNETHNILCIYLSTLQITDKKIVWDQCYTADNQSADRLNSFCPFPASWRRNVT